MSDRTHEAAAVDNYVDSKFPVMQRMAISALSESYRENVHAALYAEADVTHLAIKLDEARANSEEAPSLTGLLIQAVAQTLAENPHFNSVYADGMKRTYRDVDIGLAVAGKDGSLSVPVIRKADRMGVEEIDIVRRELADRARAKKLRNNDFTGAALTLSNLGMFEAIRFGTPIIPQGQGAILVTGAIKRGFDTRQEGGSALFLPISFGFDHRVNNGAPAAEFIQAIATRLACYPSTSN